MNVKIQHRNLEFLSSHQKLVDRQARKVRKMLPTYGSDIMDLSVNIEKLPRGSQYQTSLVLTVPQRTIRVEEIEDNPTSSIVRAFSELRRRVKRFKSQLSRERLWHRQSPSPVDERDNINREIENLAAENLDKIENYVRRELYHQVLAGTMPPGILEPHAIVDEVFLEVTTNAQAKPVTLPADQWIFQVARRVTRSRIRKVEDSKNESHVEETAARDERRSWEDEDLNFYQPDESLQLEDLLEDGRSDNPEQLFQRDEVEESLQKEIAALPDSIRESFVLFALEGFTSDEVAMMTGSTPEEVVGQVEEARQHLKKSLRR